MSDFERMTPALCWTCGHDRGSHSRLRYNCMATEDGTHATRCACKQYQPLSPRPPAKADPRDEAGTL